MDEKKMNEAVRQVLKRLHYPIEVMLVCVRGYAAYPLSLRQIEEMMAERGVVVDHATIHRWSIKMLPVLAAVFRRRKRTVGASWRMDETYVKISGEWKCLYRAVDRAGHTIDFLLRAHRNLAAARRFFERAIERHGVPEKITIDKSGANTAAIVGMCTDSGRGHRDAPIEVPQQPHRARSSRHRTRRATDARIQVVSLCARHHRRHRDHAHDQEGATRRPQSHDLIRC